MTFLWTCAIQVTVVLLLAIISLPLLRNRSAALRHWVLSCAIVVSAAIPASNLVVPVWNVPQAIANHAVIAPISQQLSTIKMPIRRGSTTVERDVSQLAPVSRTFPQSLDNRQWIVLTWAVGVLAGVIAFMTGLLRMRRLASACRPMKDQLWVHLADTISNEYKLPRTVQLLQSTNPSILVTWGVFRPKVILPEGASEWSESRTEMVLRHELAHVCRRDWLVQIVGHLLRTAYWFNPLVWIVYRRLRLESECACDDAVLARQIEGHQYADHLLALARSLNTTNHAWSAVLTMARPSTLERRFSAMLNPILNRRPLTRSAIVVTAFIGFCIAASLTLMTSLNAAPPPVPGIQAKQPERKTVIVPQTPEPRAGATSRDAAIERAYREALSAGPIPQFQDQEHLGRVIEEYRNRVGEFEKQLNQNELFSVNGERGRGERRPGAEGTQMLIKLYDSIQDVDQKHLILDYLSQSESPAAREKLRSVARSETQPDLRLTAIEYIAADADFDSLVSMYDASREPEAKLRILDHLAALKDPRVMEKLFSIAQSDPSPDMRRMAIDYIAAR